MIEFEIEIENEMPTMANGDGRYLGRLQVTRRERKMIAEGDLEVVSVLCADGMLRAYSLDEISPFVQPKATDNQEADPNETSLMHIYRLSVALRTMMTRASLSDSQHENASLIVSEAMDHANGLAGERRRNPENGTLEHL